MAGELEKDLTFVRLARSLSRIRHGDLCWFSCDTPFTERGQCTFSLSVKWLDAVQLALELESGGAGRSQEKKPRYCFSARSTAGVNSRGERKTQ